MLIKLTNTIGAIRNAIGIVRKNLQLWLDFNKSEVIGSELINPLDFTDWVNSGSTDITSNGFTTSGSGQGVYYNLLSNNSYKINVSGVVGDIELRWRDGSGGGTLLGSFDTDLYFNTSGLTSPQIYLRANNATVATVTSVSFKEVTQFVKDKSPNTNNAKLFTGKALSFDGANDYVDIDGFTMSGDTASFAFWVNPNVTSSGYLFDINPNRLLIGFGAGEIFINTSPLGTQYFGSIPLNTWSRVVITINGATAKCYIDNTQLGSDKTINLIDLSLATASSIGSKYTKASSFYNGKLSDLQIYNKAWAASDVAFDYNNPNHLAIDNPDTSLVVTDLKAYWALSEGDGDYAYNSAVALGSEEMTNGDFATDGTVDSTSYSLGFRITSSQTTGSILSNQFTVNNPSDATGTFGRFWITDGSSSINTLVLGKTYKVSYTVDSSSGLSGGSDFLYHNGASYQVIPYSNGTHTFTFTTSGEYLQFKLIPVDSNIVFSNISVKEVSVGAIVGATYDDQLTTIPQLGLMDWSKPTVGENASNEITLIADPNNPSEDILGNSVRLREHSFNLDGSGYAEIADDDSLDFGTGDFSIEAWVKFKFEDTGSSYNSIYSHGGQVNATDSFGVMTTTDKVRFIVANTNLDSSSTFTEGEWIHIVGTRVQGTNGVKLYINGDEEDVSTKNDSVSNALSKTIGKDTHANRYYKNLIDDVRIYNRALSSDEVEQNHKAGLNKHKATSSFSDDFSSDYGF